ncbi:TPA: hypothetical protein H1011_02085 [archaeon]|jgi:hypothetical protein|uniref:Uncharacterized protein n=1 Tax=Candidatus Undinarchaeum marinum TaxID=2756141 RepID=A0A832V014_9ARCH|nr:hypothetical protein [Candidatus Undinarchaeum marinum]
MNKIPNKVRLVLKDLNQDDSELAELCISRVTELLQSSGCSDARSWATNILPMVLGEMAEVEEAGDLDEWLLDLDGAEYEVVFGVQQVFSEIQDKLAKRSSEDIRDTLIYSIEKTLSEIDRVRYQRLYG